MYEFYLYSIIKPPMLLSLNLPFLQYFVTTTLIQQPNFERRQNYEEVQLNISASNKKGEEESHQTNRPVALVIDKPLLRWYIWALQNVRRRYQNKRHLETTWGMSRKNRKP